MERIKAEKMKSKKWPAIYPGSFDPITKGHIALIDRLKVFFDPLIVLVTTAFQKEYLFSLKERLELVQLSLKNAEHIQVSSYEGLTVDYARKHDIQVIIRGIRCASDFEHEMKMAMANKKLFPDCETFVVFTHPEYIHLSSQIVKDLASHNRDLSEWVPQPVSDYLKNKFARNRK